MGEIVEAPGEPLDLTLGELVEAAGGRLVRGDPAAKIGVVSSDSRTIGRGNCYFALKGERFDGHDYAADAAARGAAALVVEREIPAAAGTAQVVVADTLEALGVLARCWRLRHGGLRVAAVVGSSGKTTVKEMSSDILAPTFRVLVTRGNLNNLVGLPKMLFGLRRDHEAAVLELGMNQPDEARKLVEIAVPGVVVLTNITNAHVGMFGSLEALYDGECESLRFAPRYATLVMN